MRQSDNATSSKKWLVRGGKLIYCSLESVALAFATPLRHFGGGVRLMDLWDKYQEFPPDFLSRYRDFALYDVFHHIKAILLYPLNCGCSKDCACEVTRAKIVLSLNVDIYNKARARQENPDRLHAMKYFFRIPDDGFFRKHYGECYPLWLIDEKFCEKSALNHFQIVGRLVWTLLRLARTYELSFYGEHRASLTEAVSIILGNAPLKGKKAKQEKAIYLCGEKGYTAHFNTYKPVCHLIAAFQHMEENNPCFSLADPQKIQELFNFSQGIRHKLLLVETPNVKEKSLFSEESFLSLPSWVYSDDILIPVKPFQNKLDDLTDYIKNHSIKCITTY